MGLVDGDRVESSNLHRQVLHRSKNVGKLKVDSAIEYLTEWVSDFWITRRVDYILILPFMVLD